MLRLIQTKRKLISGAWVTKEGEILYEYDRKYWDTTNILDLDVYLDAFTSPQGVTPSYSNTQKEAWWYWIEEE